MHILFAIVVLAALVFWFIKSRKSFLICFAVLGTLAGVLLGAGGTYAVMTDDNPGTFIRGDSMVNLKADYKKCLAYKYHDNRSKEETKTLCDEAGDAAYEEYKRKFHKD